MAPKNNQLPQAKDKKPDSQIKKEKQDNKKLANPDLAKLKKGKNDACRDRRAAAGSSKSLA